MHSKLAAAAAAFVTEERAFLPALRVARAGL